MINVFQESCLKKITYQNFHSLKGNYTGASALINEEIAYQVVLYSDQDVPIYLDYELHYDVDQIKLYSVKQVPVPFPHRDDDPYPDYLTDEPSILPDCLVPLQKRGVITVGKFPNVIWVSVLSKTAGDHSVILRFHNADTDFTADFNLHIVNAVLDRSDFSYSAYLFPNGVANPYQSAPFTDIYWSHIGDYFKVLSENGVNELFVPIFPVIPPNPIFSDESQMVKVKVFGTEKNPEYRFNYDIFDCWIYMAEKYGFKRYILPSFYTDLRSKKCLQIPAIGVDATKTTLFFGSEIDCTNNYYFSFVRKFYRSFKSHLEEMGIIKKFTLINALDPAAEDTGELQRISKGIRDIFKFAPQISMVKEPNLRFDSLCGYPVVPMHKAQFFVGEDNLHNVGIYIDIDAPESPINQLIASPSVRLRALSLYWFRYGIMKFTNYSVNCVNTFELGKTVNPMLDTDNENCYPSGALSLLYPGAHCVYESIRLKQIFYAIQDFSAMRQLSHYISTKSIVNQMDASGNVGFRRCLIKEQSYLNFRERVRAGIEKRLQK